MSSSPSKPAMRWYKNPKFDAPELNSPQPCAHGAGCDYKIKDKTTGELVRGCCAFVHPGEEGTGRRLFTERTTSTESGDRVQPACVRLTGAQNGFYERRGRRIPWPVWCEQKGIPYEPNPPTTLGAREPDDVELTPAMKRVVEAAVAKALAAAGAPATGTPATGTPATPPRRTHPVSPLAPTKHNPRRPKQRVDLEAVSVELPVSSTPTFDERTLDASQQSPSLMSSNMDAVD